MPKFPVQKQTHITAKHTEQQDLTDVTNYKCENTTSKVNTCTSSTYSYGI